jgi:putative transposase
MTKPSPFRYFKTSPEIIRLAVLLYIRFPLSLRNVEDLLHDRGSEVTGETGEQTRAAALAEWGGLLVG